MGQSFASERLHGIATRLRAEGQRGTQRHMYAVFRGAAQPLIRSAEVVAFQRLPRSGGLNRVVPDRHTAVSVLTGARTAGVRLKRRDSASYQTNRGFIDHRTFGHEPWKREELPGAAGWWDDTMRSGSAAVTPLLVKEMDRVGRFIQYG